MNHITSWLRAAWPVLLVASIIIVLDQWTKEWVRNNIEDCAVIPNCKSYIPIESLGEYFVFQHVRNYGAAFGILQNQSVLFVVIAAIVAAAILFYVRYIPLNQWFVRVLLGLQLGGAMGNLIDRLFQLDAQGRGYVTDFIKMGIPDVYYWPNYNIADSAIVTGVIGLGIYIIFDDIRRQRQEKNAEAAVDSSDTLRTSDKTT